MKITVCVKQVPGTSEVEMDEDGNLIRDPSNTKMNPFDLFAIESALKIKERNQKKNLETSVAAITMGPPQAKSVVREAFMMGVDEGAIITDRKFAGSDVWATAFTIAQGIKKRGVPDLIICGKQTTDGDTAQVGPELAEFLSIPHITNVIEIVEINETSICIKCDLPTKIMTAKMSFPCLITVNKDIYTPRLPSYRRKLKTKNWKIDRLTYKDLPNKNIYNYGMKGSPTKVKRIFLPESNADHVMWRGEAEELAEKLFSELKKEKFLESVE